MSTPYITYNKSVLMGLAKKCSR